MRVVYYAILEHEEKWYLLWARSYDRDIWHVHAIYFPKTIANVDTENTKFYEQDYGDFNRKYDDVEEAADMFREKLELRKSHGYKIVGSNMPGEWK